MQRFLSRLLLPLLVVVAGCALAQGPGYPPEPRDSGGEAALVAGLAAISSDAATLFEHATGALDARDYPAARRGFEAALALAPDSPVALRRLAHVELMLGSPRRARQLAQRALRLDPDPRNATALAAALLAGDGPETREALKLARVAAELQPADAYAQAVLLGAALVNDSRFDQWLAGRRLEALAPDWSVTHYYLGLISWLDHAPPEAARRLRLAEALGMASERIEAAFDAGLRADLRLYWLWRFSFVMVGGGLLALAFVQLRAPRWSGGATGG